MEVDICVFIYVDDWTLIQLITRQGKKKRGKITLKVNRDLHLLPFVQSNPLLYYTIKKDEHIVTINVVYRVTKKLLCDVLDSSQL